MSDLPKLPEYLSFAPSLIVEGEMVSYAEFRVKDAHGEPLVFKFPIDPTTGIILAEGDYPVRQLKEEDLATLRAVAAQEGTVLSL